MAKAKKHISLRKDHAKMLEMLSKKQEVSVSELIQRYIEVPLKKEFEYYFGNGGVLSVNIGDVDSINLL